MNNTLLATAPAVILIPHISEIAGPLVCLVFFRRDIETCTDSSCEPQILGGAFNTFFLGVLSVQTSLYYFAFTNDPLKIKVVVYTVYMLEALQVAMILVDITEKFGVGLRTPSQLLAVRTLWFSLPILTGLVTYLCQGWYAFRIWKLAKDVRNTVMKWFFFVIVVICTVQLVMSFIVGLAVKSAGNLEIYYATYDYKFTSGIWYGSSALGDVLIAICMIYLLVQFKDSENPFPTQNFLEKFVRLIVGTNSVTAVCGISILVMVYMPIKSSYYQPILAVLGKLYSNSMMVQLNSRMRISMDVDQLDIWKQNTCVRRPQCVRGSQLRIRCPGIESWQDTW